MGYLQSNLWTEEVVQDVFMRIWHNRERLSEVDNPAAYIYKMAVNRTLDYIKRNAIELKARAATARLESVKDKHITQNELQFRETNKLIQEAVHHLPPQRKKIFVMVREQGLSHEEIASRLSISPHSVRNHMTYALRDIRKHLSENGNLATIMLIGAKIFF